MALGGAPGAAHCIARKPSGMWWRTYEKHRQRIKWFEQKTNVEFIQNYAHPLDVNEAARFFRTVNSGAIGFYLRVEWRENWEVPGWVGAPIG
ncbi:MAG: hypothetical protein ACJARR_003480 [Pseudophaeobacter arcticus]|jgi:hypothetical protein